MKSLGSKAIKFDIEKTDVCANNILAKFKGLLFIRRRKTPIGSKIVKN